MALAKAFFAATSIYLSGNYDYDMQLWQSLNIPIPILPLEDVTKHFDTIILFSRAALKGSNLSPLLFLFPLRVAGARAREIKQRQAVAEMLCRVKKDFVVAEAFLTELEGLWGCCDDLERQV